MIEATRTDIEVSAPQNDVLQSRSAITANIAGQGGGKTTTLAYSVGWFVLKFPEAKGFIGANTHEQLSASTMSRVIFELEKIYGLTEYERTHNPGGHYVIGIKPPPSWQKSAYRFKSYGNVMSFWNGARVFLGSLDNYKAHDGKEFAWAHLDETKDTKKEALTAVILGRLRQYGLWVNQDGGVLWSPFIKDDIAKRQGLKSWNPLYIHTSPAEGSVDWLIDLLGIAAYDKQIRDVIVKMDDYFFKQIRKMDAGGNVETETTIVISSSYWNEHNLPPGFIEKRKAYLSLSEQLKFIFAYPFGRNGGEFFPGFDRFKHLGRFPYIKGKSLHTAWDFNASPYVTCLVAHVEYVHKWYDRIENKKYLDKPANNKNNLEWLEILQIRFIKEFCIPDGGVDVTADEFGQRYAEDKPDIFVNGDASGHSRIEGMGALTNYKMVENGLKKYFYLANGWLRAKKSNIGVGLRRDLMNRIWEDKVPEVEVLIDYDCTTLIRDCEYLLKDHKTGGKYKEKEKDKNGLEYEKIGHCGDAMEYLVCELCKDKFIQ